MYKLDYLHLNLIYNCLHERYTANKPRFPQRLR